MILTEWVADDKLNTFSSCLQAINHHGLYVIVEPFISLRTAALSLHLALCSSYSVADNGAMNKEKMTQWTPLVLP